MSKRKTRQEKIIAQLRRKVSQNIQPTQAHSHSVVHSLKNTYTPIQSQSIALDHRFFKTDLLKTLFVTGLILSIELILFVLMKR